MAANVTDRQEHGSRFVGFLGQVPCGHCGNTRKMELHAVYSSAGFLWFHRDTYYCLSLSCPVCHHGESIALDRELKASEIPEVVAPGQRLLHAGDFQLALTAAYYQNLTGRHQRSYRVMLKALGLEELLPALCKQ